ncbi:hypothetical protein Q5P01_010881 [Channa striata]|uniref:Uncharacterized protein n=1 Tax=Channa striata TaxID=64152 RepID=A0AA88MWD4_CHASR|nr:hypothetical protein Q5P01_010881 [Channa striata]
MMIEYMSAVILAGCGPQVCVASNNTQQRPRRQPEEDGGHRSATGEERLPSSGDSRSAGHRGTSGKSELAPKVRREDEKRKEDAFLLGIKGYVHPLPVMPDLS